jgi:hypothetical protein
MIELLLLLLIMMLLWIVRGGGWQIGRTDIVTMVVGRCHGD